MLEKSDLKNITDIIKKEISPVKSDIQNLKDTLNESILKHTEKAAQDILNEVRPEFQSIKKDIKKIKNDQKLIVNFFDSEYLTLRARVERIETVLSIKPLQNL